MSVDEQLNLMDGLRLPPISSQEEKDPVVQVEFLDGQSGHAWYVLEGSREAGDYRFYGFDVGKNLPRRRYFRFSELVGQNASIDIRPRRCRWSQIHWAK